MKFSDIPNSILNVHNNYELQKGIQTTKVECKLRYPNCALFIAHKSDNTRTLFYARTGKRQTSDDNWTWFCPSEHEIHYLMPQIWHFYDELNSFNDNVRTH